MNRILKILIGISILFLLLGITYAVDIDKLQTPKDYNDLKSGSASYKTYNDRLFFIEKLNTPSVYFENSTKYMVTPVGDNIYYSEDTAFDYYGYCEAVDLDGETYYVSLYQKSKLSPGEKTQLLNDIKEFNKLNKLEPIAM